MSPEKQRANRPGTIRAEADRDRPTGAGAAPGRQDRQPRAAWRRGRTDQRSLQFYGHLREILPIARQAAGWISLKYAATAKALALGEFRGLARWAASPVRQKQPAKELPQPRDAGIDAGGEDPREGWDGLGALLAGIADDVHQHAATAREGVMRDFAARIAHARKHLSRHLFVATLGSIIAARKAALALISRCAALELASRRKAAVAAFGGRPPRLTNRSGRQPGPKPSR